MVCTCCGAQRGNIAYNGKCEDCYIDGCFPASDRKRAYWAAQQEKRAPRGDDRHRRNLKSREMSLESLE